MRTDYQTGKAQGTRIHNCGLCGRQFYESLLRECPEREGRRICMYCCRSCPNSIREGTGEGCSAMPKKKKGKKGDPSSTASGPPSPEGKAEKE